MTKDAPVELPLDPVEAATAALVSGAKIKGTEVALHFLREHFDPDVHILSVARPDRHSRADGISKVLVEINGHRRMIMVESFEGGNFKLYIEVNAKTPDHQADKINAFYGE